LDARGLTQTIHGQAQVVLVVLIGCTNDSASRMNLLPRLVATARRSLPASRVRHPSAEDRARPGSAQIHPIGTVDVSGGGFGHAASHVASPTLRLVVGDCHSLLGRGRRALDAPHPPHSVRLDSGTCSSACARGPSHPAQALADALAPSLVLPCARSNPRSWHSVCPRVRTELERGSLAQRVASWRRGESEGSLDTVCEPPCILALHHSWPCVCVKRDWNVARRSRRGT